MSDSGSFQEVQRKKKKKKHQNGRSDAITKNKSNDSNEQITDFNMEPERVSLPPDNQPDSITKVNDWKTTEPLTTYAKAALAEDPYKRKLPSFNPVTTAQENRKKCTFTFFSLTSSEPMETTILDTLKAYFKEETFEFVVKCQRDTRYRSRYNVVFGKETYVTKLFLEGITIAGQRIKGAVEKRAARTSYTRFYIPNFPAWGSKRELLDLLKDHGSVVFLKEKTHAKYGVPLGGWSGSFLGRVTLPDFINYEDEDFAVIDVSKIQKHHNEQHEQQNNKQTPTEETRVEQELPQATTKETHVDVPQATPEAPPAATPFCAEPPVTTTKNPSPGEQTTTEVTMKEESIAKANPPTEEQKTTQKEKKEEKKDKQKENTPWEIPKSPPLSDEEKKRRHQLGKKYCLNNRENLEYMSLNNRQYVYESEQGQSASDSSTQTNVSSTSQKSIMSTASGFNRIKRSRNTENLGNFKKK